MRALFHKINKPVYYMQQCRTKYMKTPKKTTKDRALDHFDDFYGSVFGEKWKSIRVALLSPHKYCAVVNNFGDTEEIMKQFENDGAINVRTLINLEKEYIRDEKETNDQNETIKKIYKLDETLENIIASKNQIEVDKLYSTGERTMSTISSISSIEEKQDNHEVVANKDLSLKSSLERAEIDTSRIIDPSVGLTAAALYEYIPATKLKGMEDWVLESDHYRYYENKSDFPVTIQQQNEINFPSHLQVYSYERGNITPFKSPRKGSTGVLNYYLMDSASILPVLALGLNPGDKVLDMCAAPGGKSLIMLQTLYPDVIFCNEVQESRMKRISNMFQQYLYDFEKWNNRIVIRKGDGRNIADIDYFDKILVDVPCTTDRHSVLEDDNNFFKPTRTKERLKLPELQASLLTSALKLVKVGGSVVYSTCSLSPIQNDGVVHMALKKIWEETSIEIVVMDLKSALKPMRCLYQIDEFVSLKYGHLVTPFLPCNSGPMYFCKLTRNK